MFVCLTTSFTYLSKRVIPCQLNQFLQSSQKIPKITLVSTVCPRYNAPRYNADSGITRSTVAPEN